MWLLHILLFLTGILITVYKTILIKNLLPRVIFILSVSLLPFFLVNFSSTFNINTIKDFLNDYYSLSIFCIITLTESLLFIILLPYCLSREKLYQKIIFNLLKFFPQTATLSGIFFTHILILNEFSGKSFINLTARFSSGIFVLLSIITALSGLIIKKFDTKINILLGLNFFMIIISMFLPLLFNIQSHSVHFVKIMPFELIFGLIIITTISYTAYKKNINKEQ